MRKSFAAVLLLGLLLVAGLHDVEGCARRRRRRFTPAPTPPPPTPPPVPNPPPPSPPPPPPSPPPPSPPPPPFGENTVEGELFDERTFVKTPGLVLCVIPAGEGTEENPSSCYAKVPATIYMDMEMYQVDHPADCACGVAVDSNPTLTAITGNVFDYHSAKVFGLEFIVWDINNGVKLRSLNSFQLTESLNTKEYVASLLNNPTTALRELAGFYSHVNDFNPGDFIVDPDREVTLLCFKIVMTYRENTANPYACNEGNKQGEKFAVQNCKTQGILDPEITEPFKEYPYRNFQRIPTPPYEFQVATGSTNENGNGPGGSHALAWLNSTFPGAGECTKSSDCQSGNICDLSFSQCVMCITNGHCSKFDQPGAPAVCVKNNGNRVCQYGMSLPPAPSPGAVPPAPLETGCGTCDGGYCQDGQCVDCRNFNDCELQYTQPGEYAKICNSTSQCVYNILPPSDESKKTNKAVVVAVATGAAVVAAAVIAGVVGFLVMKYKASKATYKDKLIDTNMATSNLNESPLYRGETTKVSNPTYAPSNA